MANALSSFDPVGSFQRARSNALTIAGQEADAALQPQRNELASLNLQKAKQGLQAGQLSSDQQSAATASRFIVNSNQALLQIPLEQRAAALQSLVPQAQQAGIDVGSLDLSKPLTDDVLNNAIQSAGTILQTLQSGGTAPSFQKGATTIVETESGPAFATSVLNPLTGETTASIAPINATLVSDLGETGAELTIRKIEEAAGRADAIGISDRNQEIITNGLAAADGTGVLKRGIGLLNDIETGGISRAQLAAKQLFGIETADEGELSNLLGKAVLGQLRETFGAAFTAQEGQSLKAIDANMGKSPAANKRLLQNALRIAEKSATRAIDRAVESGDFRTAADIQDSLDFVLQPFEAEVPTGITDNGDGTFTMEDGTVLERE